MNPAVPVTRMRSTGSSAAGAGPPQSGIVERRKWRPVAGEVKPAHGDRHKRRAAGADYAGCLALQAFSVALAFDLPPAFLPSIASTSGCSPSPYFFQRFTDVL